MDCWAAWSSMTAEQRRQAAVLRDTAIAGKLHAQLQALWWVQIQHNALGFVGQLHSFDPEQLPLLSAMDFTRLDGEALAAAGSAPSKISWRPELHEDPASMEVAVKRALGSTGSRGALPPRQWKQLVHTAPQTWLDLEWSLAGLVEQVVMRAAAADARHGARSVSEEASGAQASRAAKRLRQRERRKLCRMGLLGDDKGAPMGLQPELGYYAGAVRDDAASERSTSAGTGGAPSEPERPDSARAADSSSEASGHGGCCNASDFAEGSAAASGDRRRSKAPSRYWCDASDDEDALSVTSACSLSLRGPHARCPEDPEADDCATPAQLWPPTPEQSPHHGPLAPPSCPPLLSLPCLAPGLWQLA
uniref:Uncharacterized protein n=1 Tax=Alexandrium catenella TaxID=2925 RepID=A0A7S1M3A7_ALECA|mmetsp:Transcript_19135/g.52099  ORF Transcript_19135/g.52099 Transcript_19135/m.52099 type:complete len:362 (+) Transcript_19135:91-1176(+)